MFRDYIDRHQNALLAISLVLIALLGFFIFDTVSKHGLHSIPVATVPSDAKIELNGAPVKSGSLLLPEGTHTLVASKEGFLTKTVSFTVEKDTDYTNFESFLLAPISEEAKKWASDNKALYGNFADSKAIIDPVFAFLPYGDLLINLSSESTTTPVTISVKSLGIYKNAPIDYLKRSGIDPSNYKYVYNYDSPFIGVTNE